MAIERNAISGGNFIREPGDYKVKVAECKTGNSKTGKPMLTVAFETEDGLKIAGYFVRDLKFHMIALEKLKIAAGLQVTQSAEHLVGKEVGIAVEAQDPDPNGRIFMAIVGYGPAKDVGPRQQKLTSDDEVPF